MKYTILLLGLWAGNCYAGWYAELGLSTEFGERTLLSKPDRWCPNCQANSILFHGAVGYRFKIKNVAESLFIEIDHKSLIHDEDDKEGYYGATFGFRFGD